MPPDVRIATELRISREARSRYGFAASRFSNDGHVILDDVRSVRVLAQEINDKRDLTGDPPKEQAVKAGQLNAMALIDAILGHVADLYRQQRNPQFLEQAQQWLAGQIGRGRWTPPWCDTWKSSRRKPSTGKRSRPRPIWPARRRARLGTGGRVAR